MNTVNINALFTSPPRDSVERLELSVRANNVLGCNSIRTIPELLAASSVLITRMRNSGEVTWKEIIRALLKKFYKPQWLQDVLSQCHYSEVERITETQAESALKQDGWSAITSGYKPSEYWMLENAIANLERGGIEYRLYRVENDGIKIFRKGGIFDDGLDDAA